MNIISSAMPMAASGTISGIDRKNSSALLPRNRSRASTRAAGRLIARQITVTASPMPTVFNVASQMRL